MLITKSSGPKIEPGGARYSIFSLMQSFVLVQCVYVSGKKKLFSADNETPYP